MVLARNFYHRPSQVVAKELLGKVLVRAVGESIVSGVIVETEAYLEKGDFASHAIRGKTAMTQSLYLDAGHSYVHRIHNQYCLDIVAGGPEIPTGVLIRALEPAEGIKIMRRLRPNKVLLELTSGPGKLCQALNIDRNLDGVDITNVGNGLYVEDRGIRIEKIIVTPRIGIAKSKELNLRYFVDGNRFVSKKAIKA